MTNAEIIAAYNAGKTAGQLAQMTGRTRGAIAGILHRASVNGGDLRQGRIVSEDNVLKALRLRDAKWPVKAIAKMIGTSDNNMHRIFRECDHD